MVRQLVRREVRLDPAQIVGIVREALGVLPVSSRSIRVTLHPDDASLVREAYAIGDHDQKWQIVEDPVIQRGGCRVTHRHLAGRCDPRLASQQPDRAAAGR
jgi:flagellar assembly protein FliH